MALSVLVTGAAGYIGSVLCEHLLDAGHRVTALDNLTYSGSALLPLCGNVRFEFVCGDVRDEQLLARLLASADVVVPLAALVGAPLCERDPWQAKRST
jgi:nucleoside-diphosphate-sugar epimerase